MYSLNGNLIDSITDKVMDNKIVSRKVGNSLLKIKNNKLTYKEEYFTLPSIKLVKIMIKLN